MDTISELDNDSKITDPKGSLAIGRISRSLAVKKIKWVSRMAIARLLLTFHRAFHSIVTPFDSEFY
jgi:hypothetical protein